jgi:hypothetical protein
VTTISVKVEKMFSDGNYGHQSAEVSYTAEVEDGVDVLDATNMLLARATAHVRVQLGESETLNIRRAVNPRPRLCNHCVLPLGDWDNHQHKACEEEQRAERDRKRAATAERGARCRGGPRRLGPERSRGRVAPRSHYRADRPRGCAPG